MHTPLQTSTIVPHKAAHWFRFPGLSLAALTFALVSISPLQAQQGQQPATGSGLGAATSAAVSVGEQFRASSLSDYAIPERHQAAITPYDLQALEPSLELGLGQQELGDHRAAVNAFEQALQIMRINYGLFHEAQVPLVESIIFSLMEMQEWEAVDQRFDYLAHLYERLYDTDDPRLEKGLQKISSYHVNAFNINLEGRGEYHLRKAANLFKLQLEVAEQTLTEDHPRLDYLHQSLELSRAHLYLLSNSYRERVKSAQQANRDGLLADLR